MKKRLLIVACTVLFFGCNMNPSKEARIQELEAKLEQTIDRIDKLENRVQVLEGVNKTLQSRKIELGK